ncbi:MAG: YifB family Mg chelatase-like AAA ATPase [Myxococcota bacterium]|jgi:magnesium chelatase family protein|nr:YifB family Mg chelatase-like AAA ATPase [Myxococcota bacterium]
MLAKVSSGAVLGITGYRIEIEVQLGFGVVNFWTVGLPEGAVKEARMRIRSAMIESGFGWPARSVTVNLAPADIRKEGSALDLPMAVALMAADGRLPLQEDVLSPQTLIVGELGLSGEVRKIRGVLPLAVMARQQGLRAIVVPKENAQEAALVEGIDVLPVGNLRELVEHLKGIAPILPQQRRLLGPLRANNPLDFDDVCGQESAKRALEVAAAGGHNLLFCGPPGAGKTMLARRLPSILPALEFEEALELTTICSVAGLLDRDGLIRERPFRAPHHTISDVGLIGGGSPSPRPGEVSLAHHGVLFLDELPEFRRGVLEVLRQPLEDGRVSITRRLITVDYPANVMLVASMNNCPCGYLGSTRRSCSCRSDQIERYRARISGPLLDRIDIQVNVADLAYRELSSAKRRGEPSVKIRARVEAARAIQRQRLRASGVFCNAQLQAREIRHFCSLDEQGHRLVERAVERFGLSARAYHRVLKVARTIADLEQAEAIGTAHLAEAIAYRCLDQVGGQRERAAS